MQPQGPLSIQRMCELAGVSRASFYRHWARQEPAAAETELRAAVQQLALSHRHYGYRRIAVLLRREGYVAGAKTVRRLMREDSLLAIRRRRFVLTTNSDHRFQVWPNLAQYLELTDVNQLWVADFTFLRLEEEFAYLAVVLDAYSRRVIGWALGKAMNGALTVQALKKALQLRHPPPGLVHHSDQGSQYACVEYVDLLERHGAVLSMSRAGCPWENGRCESFIKTLKQEEIDARPYRTMDELAAHVEEFIEQVYNPIRLHSALDYRSPMEFEQQHASNNRQATWLPASMSFPRHEEISSDVLDQARQRRDEREARPGHSSE
jgi:transposase InsO family protein